MPSLIEQIQRDCVDPTVSVSNLLRKVKLAAAKLGVAEVEDWVTNELEGYKGDVPDYRIVSGTPMGEEPYVGARPILGSGVDNLSQVPNRQAIAAIEDHIASGNENFTATYSAKVAKILDERNQTRAHYFLLVPRSQLVRIVDRVRTLVLDWTTRLEKVGVGGADFSFTDSDRQKAQGAAMHITIGTVEQFTGNLGHGNVSGAITSGALDVDGVRTLMTEMRRYAGELVKAGTNAKSLEGKIGTIEAELEKAKPDQSALRGFLADMRNALSGAAGNIIASGVLSRIGALLGA